MDDIKEEPVLSPSRWHRTVNGTALVVAREILGLTQSQFAARCGYHKSFQSQIEKPGYHEVRVEIANKIAAILG